MPHCYYCHYNKQVLTVASVPFASGGEGKLYHVTEPQGNNWIAKIYHPYKRSVGRANKMAYLKENPYKEEDSNIAWVIDILEDKQGKFVGILMPYQPGQQLETLCATKLPNCLGAAWQAFAWEQPLALTQRLRLGVQLAAAVADLHASQQYILADLKPENILVQANGQLRLVDLDSVAVVKQGTERFAASVATPEYAPPEHYNAGTALFPSWDNFSLAAILYKLFCGIHPYAATAGTPYEEATSLGQKIKYGLFVHSKTNAAFLKVIPPPHQRFITLPRALQKCFLQCFETGHERPEKRPTANVWCWTLLEVIGDTQLIHQFRDQLTDGWDLPRIPFLLPSVLLEQQQLQKEAPLAIVEPTFKAVHIFQEKKELLHGLENNAVDSFKKSEKIFVGFIFVLLVVVLVVGNYERSINQECRMVIIAVAFLVFVSTKYWRKVKLKRLFKKYQKQLQRAVVKQEYLLNKWKLWKSSQELKLYPKLKQLQQLITTKDSLVRKIEQERLAAYKKVNCQFQEAIEQLNLPLEWGGLSWTSIQTALKIRQREQEQVLHQALGEQEAQLIYRQALETAIKEFQQSEQLLLDQARVLFDWDAFF